MRLSYASAPWILVALAMPLGAQTNPNPAQEPKPAVEPKPAETQKPRVREFTIINLEYKDSKVWVPSTLIVKKGDKIRLTLINRTPSGEHGFAIDEFLVRVVVTDKEKKIVEFTADKPGLFRTYCQMHPAHVAGQLLVLE